MNLETMNSKVVFNYFYNLIYQFLALALPILTVPYVSRVLGASQLGNYYYVNAIVNYFGIFAVLGTVDYGQREIAKNQDNLIKRSKLFWEIFYFRIIFSSIALVVYFIFVFNFSIKYRSLFFASILMFISWAFDVSWYFQGVENFKVTALKNGLIKILATISIFVFVKTPQDVVIYTFIYAVASVLGNLTMVPHLRKEIVHISITLKDIFSNFKGIMELFLPVVAIQLYTVLNRIMLGAMSTSMQVGYFSQITTVVSLPIAIVSSLAAALIPRIANLFENKKKTEMKKYIEIAIGYVYMLSCPMVIGCLAIGNIFVPVFFGKSYEPAIPILYVLSFLFIILSLGQLLGPFLIAINRQNGYTLAVTLAAAVNLILNFILLYFLHKGALGVSIATIVAELTSTISEAIFLHDLLKAKYFIKYFARYIFLSLPIILVIIVIKILFSNLITIVCLGVIISILIYFLTLLIFRDPIFRQLITPFINRKGSSQKSTDEE